MYFLLVNKINNNISISRYMDINNCLQDERFKSCIYGLYFTLLWHIVYVQIRSFKNSINNTKNMFIQDLNIRYASSTKGMEFRNMCFQMPQSQSFQMDLKK